MRSVTGTYQNGRLQLDREYTAKKPVKVIITFLEEVESVPQKSLSFADFSFAKSRKALEDYKGSFADAVTEERRSEV